MAEHCPMSVKREEGLQWEPEIRTCIRKWSVTKLHFVTAWGWSEMKVCLLGSWPICRKYCFDLWAVSLTVDIAPYKIQLQCYKKSSMRRNFHIWVFTSGIMEMVASKRVLPKFWMKQLAVFGSTPLLEKLSEDTWEFYSSFKVLSGILLRNLITPSVQRNKHFFFRKRQKWGGKKKREM